MSDFILKIKGIADSLTTAGQTMTDQDIIMSVLHGLGVEYDSAVMYITARQDLMTLK